MPEELKPCECASCRFCEQSCTGIRTNSKGSKFWVVCGNTACGVEGPFRNSEAEAIAAWNTRPVSELERLAREVIEARCAVDATKIYSSARVVANRRAANAFGALAAYLAEPSQKGNQE